MRSEESMQKPVKPPRQKKQNVVVVQNGIKNRS